MLLLTVDQLEKTRRCLDSLLQIQEPDHRIFLWDNGSRDGTAERVEREYPAVHVRHYPENIGVASGRNAIARVAIQEYDPTHLLFLDNDTTVEPGLLAALVAPFADDPGLAQTTAKIRFLGQPQILYGAGGCAVRFWLGSTAHAGYGETDQGQHDTPHRCIASGGCMCVPSDLFLKLGGFDATFDPYGPEDLDFGLRAVRAGYHGLYVPQAVIYHDPTPGRTFEGGDYSQTYAQHRSKHWFLFMARHASPWQKAGFFLIGGPYRLFVLMFREARRGNLMNAVRGLWRGAASFMRSN